MTQRTAATVQWTVFESDSGDFDAEAPVGSAIYEVRSEGIQCRYWEAWLNESTAQFRRAISFPDSSTMIILSLLTQVTMMRISDVTKRPVQQAVVLSHGAAELYHEGLNVTSWDVWIRLVELPGVERGPQHE